MQEIKKLVKLNYFQATNFQSSTIGKADTAIYEILLFDEKQEIQKSKKLFQKLSVKKYFNDCFFLVGLHNS